MRFFTKEGGSVNWLPGLLTRRKYHMSSLVVMATYQLYIMDTFSTCSKCLNMNYEEEDHSMHRVITWHAKFGKGLTRYLLAREPYWLRVHA